MTFSVATTIFGKFASLASQFVLGWLLSKSDFGLYAAATSCVSLASALRDGGSGKYLIQQGAEFARYASSVRRIAWAFNILAALVLLVLSQIKSRDEGYAGVQGLLILISLSIVIASPSVLGRAMASYRLEFKSIAQITSMTIVIRYASMIMLAVFGFGVYSFAIPLVLVAIAETMAFGRLYRRLMPVVDSGTECVESNCIEILRSTKWIMLGAVAIALINTGDYLVLGSYLQPEVLGVYFFGYQLSVAVSSVFTASMQQVLLPVFGKLQENKDGQLELAVHKSLGLLFALSGPVCVAAALFSPTLISILWGDKWTSAVPVCQAMLLSLSIRLSTPVVRAAIESLGRWRLQSVLLWIDAIGILSVCMICLVLNVSSVTAIAIAIAGYRMLMGVAQLAICCWQTRLGFRQCAALLVPVLFSVAFFFTFQSLGSELLSEYSSQTQSIFSTMGFLLVIQCLLFLSNPYRELVLIFSTKLKKVISRT